MCALAVENACKPFSPQNLCICFSYISCLCLSYYGCYYNALSLVTLSFQVQVIGDSHVRRISQMAGSFFLDRKLEVSFRHRGGATVDFLSIPPGQEYFDVVVFALGSNDLDSGLLQPGQLLDRLVLQANDYIAAGLCSRVIIMGLWPRANRFFNRQSRLFNELGSAQRSGKILFWNWSRKLKVRIGADRVHLVQNSYRRALKYLASPMLYVLKYR